MQNSTFLSATSSVRKHHRYSAASLAAGVLASSLLLGTSAAQAVTYDIQNGSIRSILNLDLNFDESSPQPDGLYNIFWVSGPGELIYGEDPDFDLALAEDAVAALPQILDAINAAPEEVTGAGPSDTDDFYIPGLQWERVLEGAYGAAGGEYFPLVPGWDQCDNNGGSNCLAGITALNPGVVQTYARLEPVPVPAAVWLFGSGLVGLIGVARRKKA